MCARTINLQWRGWVCYNSRMKCFVIAMESEAEPVIANMTALNKATVCGRHAYTGRLCGRDVAVIVCGVGKVNAACGAQLAADRYSADCIINIGVAGGLNRDCEVGAIYSISHAVQYDFDLAQLNGTPIGTLNEFGDRYLPLSVAGGYPKRRLATGDRFNDDVRDFETLTKDMHADIRDMEGGAIVQACAHAGVAVYSFKAISDIAGSGSTTEQFTRNLAMCTERLKADICGIFADVCAAEEGK